MNIIQSIFTIDAHTTGSPIRVVTGGIPNLKGKNISEKMDCMMQNYDNLRTFLLQQPRGCLSLMCAVLTDTNVEGADFGLFYMDAGGYQPMCGAGTMAAAKCIVESGMVKRTSPKTRVTFETGAGLVSVDVNETPQGTTTTLNNAPAFLYMQDKLIDVPTIGKIKFDMVFGGNFFAVVDTQQLGFKITPQSIPTMA
ncbi:MAG: proline racemase family protein, partial [Oscillospiraceae bacterium]